MGEVWRRPRTWCATPIVIHGDRPQDFSSHGDMGCPAVFQPSSVFLTDKIPFHPYLTSFYQVFPGFSTTPNHPFGSFPSHRGVPWCTPSHPPFIFVVFSRSQKPSSSWGFPMMILSWTLCRPRRPGVPLRAPAASQRSRAPRSLALWWGPPGTCHDMPYLWDIPWDMRL